MKCTRNRWYASDAKKVKQKKDFYDTLKVTPQCSQKQIKSAYYALCQIYHPDKNIGNRSIPEKFAEVSDAYKILSNPTLRNEYDRSRKVGIENQYTDSQPQSHATNFDETQTQTASSDKKYDTWTKTHTEFQRGHRKKWMDRDDVTWEKELKGRRAKNDQSSIF